MITIPRKKNFIKYSYFISEVLILDRMVTEVFAEYIVKLLEGNGAAV